MGYLSKLWNHSALLIGSALKIRRLRDPKVTENTLTDTKRMMSGGNVIFLGELCKIKFLCNTRISEFPFFKDYLLKYT